MDIPMDVKILSSIPSWQWPPGAGAELLRVIQDPREPESARRIAVDLAGDLVVLDDELARALLTVLDSKDESDEIRSMAAISLGPVLELADIEEFEEPEDVPIEEPTFREIQATLQRLFEDTDQPKLVRRRVLEASVRAPQNWHQNAVRDAYAKDDSEWKLTGIFSMRWIRGFDDEILESLKIDAPQIRYEAVCAAGKWEVKKAWEEVSNIVKTRHADKALLLAAIEAVADIRPKEAGPLLVDLANSSDEDIAEAASEAMTMAELSSDDFFDDFESDGYEDEDEDEEEGELGR